MNTKLPAPDVALKEFFSRNEIFADLFNTVLFDNEIVLHPEELRKEDTAYAISMETVHGAEKISKYRDVVRKASQEGIYTIFAIENQERIHYMMPLRQMLYDSLSYITECRESTKNGTTKGWTADEFLSGISKETKLTPVVSIVVYYGEQAWDGPRSLHDMLQIEERYKKFVPDYPIYLIEVGDPAKQFSFQTEPLKQLFECLKAVYQKKKDSTLVVSGEILKLVGILTGSKKLYHRGKQGGEIMVANCVQELIEEGRIEGRKEGKKEGIVMLAASLLGVLDDEIIAEKSGLTLEEIKQLREKNGK